MDSPLQPSIIRRLKTPDHFLTILQLRVKSVNFLQGIKIFFSVMLPTSIGYSTLNGSMIPGKINNRPSTRVQMTCVFPLLSPAWGLRCLSASSVCRLVPVVCDTPPRISMALSYFSDNPCRSLFLQTHSFTLSGRQWLLATPLRRSLVVPVSTNTLVHITSPCPP